MHRTHLFCKWPKCECMCAGPVCLRSVTGNKNRFLHISTYETSHSRSHYKRCNTRRIHWLHSLPIYIRSLYSTPHHFLSARCYSMFSLLFFRFFFFSLRFYRYWFLSITHSFSPSLSFYQSTVQISLKSHLHGRKSDKIIMIICISTVLWIFINKNKKRSCSSWP